MTSPAPIQIHPLAQWLAGLPLLARPETFAALVWGLFIFGLAASFVPLLPVARPLLDRLRLPRRLRGLLDAGWPALAWQAVVLVTARLPCLAFPYELQQDESQFASQAVTLLHDPVFYRAVDGGSAGPLDSHVLWLALLAGQAIDYFTVRCVGLLLWWLGVVAVHRAALRAAGPVAATAASWTATATYAFACQLDFMSYQSELLPAALAAWGGWAVLRLRGPADTATPGTAFLLGLVCGALPLAKLQAVPLGLALAALGYAAICWQPRDAPTRSPDRRMPLAGWLTGGGLLVPACFGGVFIWAGVGERFVRLYLLGGAAYTTLSSPDDRLFRRYPRLPLAEREPGWECLVAAVLVTAGVVVVRWCTGRLQAGRERCLDIAVAATLTAAACGAAAAPGRCYVHYLTLTILPACLLLGLLLGLLAAPAGATDRGVGSGRRPTVAWCLALSAVIAGPVITWTGITWPGLRPTPLRIVATGGLADDPRDTFPALAPLVHLSRPGDRLAVWGWQSSYHVYAQLPQGWPGYNPALMRVPRETLSPLQRTLFNADPVANDFLARETLADFRRQRPAFVIDATGPNAAIFRDRDRFGLHAWPEFAALVNADYRLVFSSPVDRLYLRADLVSARLPAGAPTPAAPR
ncbi:MAG: hypothetical protein ACK6CT_07300 [Planctomycetia bacterium]|jgi:hypothetical protein